MIFVAVHFYHIHFGILGFFFSTFVGHNYSHRRDNRNVNGCFYKYVFDARTKQMIAHFLIDIFNIELVIPLLSNAFLSLSHSHSPFRALLLIERRN